MPIQKYRNGTELALRMVYSPLDVLKLFLPARLCIRTLLALPLRVQGRPTKAALVIRKYSYAARGPSGKYMLVPSNVLDETVHENYNSFCGGSWAVGASIELRVLWTN